MVSYRMGSRDVLGIEGVERIMEQVYKIPYKESGLPISQPFCPKKILHPTCELSSEIKMFKVVVILFAYFFLKLIALFVCAFARFGNLLNTPKLSMFFFLEFQ